METGGRYMHLAHSLNNLGRVEQATRATQIYYRQSIAHPHKMVDPFLGEESGITINRNLIDCISENLSKIQFSFHPSYYTEANNNDCLQSWKHLIYIHIPKCAGTNFAIPLSSMLNHIQLKNQVESKHSNASCKHYLWHGNLGGKFMHDAFLSEAFRGKELNDLQGSFLANHGGEHGNYNKHLQEAGISAKKICLVRDPSERLYSHIRMVARHKRNKSDLLNRYGKELWNLMDKYIYDYNLSNEYDEPQYCNPFDYEICDEINFLDITDNSTISKVKSSFLSATVLPNIVQHNKLNSDKDKTTPIGSLGEKYIQDIHKELISQGFLERDNQIDLEHLKKRTRERLTFPDLINKGSVLHPITFIVPKSGNSKLILTKDFIADPLGAIDC